MAVFDADRKLIAQHGEIDRPFFLRSSAKPFQGFVSVESGAQLDLVELAVACASHDGEPVHVAIAEQVLAKVGLDQDDLRCPPDWPLSRHARQMLAIAGHRSPRRIWHNCSGKHAAWLAACVARGWPTDSYLDPDHPLQKRVRELITELGEYPADPIGVDGCGAPVLRTTTRAMGLMFAKLATDAAFGEIYRAMHTYPALVSGVGNGDSLIATAYDAAAKRGALGCIGVAVRGQWGVGVKSWDGSDVVAALAAASALGDVGRPARAVVSALTPVTSPPQRGGGEVVGRMESRLELIRT